MMRCIRFRHVVLAAGALAALATTGCRSRYVEATVKNASGADVSLVEVDYPTASFGREVLKDGAEYHYRFKVLGTGATKVSWTDAEHHEHTVNGPVLNDGQEGRLTVTLTAKSANWNVMVKEP